MDQGKFAMLTVTFGKSIMSRTQVQLWYNWFKEGREDFKDDAHPSTSTTYENIEAVKNVVLNNHRITIREVAANVDISQFLRMF